MPKGGPQAWALARSSSIAHQGPKNRNIFSPVANNESIQFCFRLILFPRSERLTFSSEEETLQRGKYLQRPRSLVEEKKEIGFRWSLTCKDERFYANQFDLFLGHSR